MPVKERPILFSGPMIRALLNGKKTQTRRIIKRQPDDGGTLVGPVKMGANEWGWHYNNPENRSEAKGKYFPNGVIERVKLKCPYGTIGDRLWVRETWAFYGMEAEPDNERPLFFRADDDTQEGWATPPDLKWRPSIFMPRWASRLTLEITDIRVERLQDISEEDAIAEGIWKYGEENAYKIYTPTTSFGTSDPRKSFASLWESINGSDSWKLNPWVWCLSFKVVPQP